MSTSTSIILRNALERLEDNLTSPVLRQNSYQELQNVLNTGEAIDKDTARRLLAVCIHDLSEDIKYATNATTVIGSLLVKIKKGQCSQPPNLVSSAISVTSLLKTIASANKFDALKGILFNTLLSYPDNTLCVVAENTEKVIDFLNAYIVAWNKVVPITFLTTLLKILPPANKIRFVKEALGLWFAKVIPLAMSSIQADLLVMPGVELLELLTEVLVNIEYTENTHWKILIECIYNPKKYPAIMKNMLENKSDFWHRLWIVFIKLLKDQITKVSHSSGSPINSLLPVVEAAFKMDPQNRCRAFQCWSVLIDNFSRESNEAYVNKRLKLLLIPLKSTNAKVEETGISKFNTWWHLIRQFHCRIEGLTEMILMPFIHFCFGKTASKMQVAPGQFSDTLKELSLQALVEIFGHVDCEGCVNIPKLKSRLISTKVLVDHWNEWISCFKIAVSTALGSSSELMMQQITCIWKSLIMTIGELPQNNIRKDLFNELLALISSFVQGCQNNTKLAGVVMILIKSLFEEEYTISALLETKDSGPMYMILPMLSNSFLTEFYNGKSIDELLSFFKPVTTFMMNEILCCPNRITTWLLKRLPASYYCLVLWMALADAVCESEQDLSEATLVSVLSYPIQKLSEYNNENCTIAAYKWFTTYSILRPKLGNANFDKECLKIILEQTEGDPFISNIFILHVSLSVVKQKLLRKIDDDCVYVTQIFFNSLSSVDIYSSIEKVIPALIDTLILMCSKLKECMNVQFAETVVSAYKLTVRLLLQQTVNDNTVIFVEKILLSLLEIVKVKEYQDLVLIINDEILECSTIAKKYHSKINYPLSILTTHLSDKIDKNISEISKQENSNKTVAKINENNDNMNKNSENYNNTKEDMKSSETPNPNNFCKKSNKRAASIVNTVVENGEEYVVVKTNWKFNPRQLTENQKEKLKRKREDIPALYQDLSQSQDECSLRAWKTDTQEATTTTSSESASKSNEKDATIILSQISNTDVVPRILENILAESAKHGANIDDKSSDDNFNVNNNLKLQKQSLTPTVTKSPRLALKDRVFRNVRNLVKSSSLLKDVTLSSTEDMNKTLNENVSKTSKANTTNVVNSAPPKIVSERPSRVIKKPKKFDDSEIISLKKRRQSQEARTDASEINNLKKMQQSQDAQSIDSEIKNSLQSQDSQSNDAETISLKTKQQSQNSRPDVSKISSIKKRRQSEDLKSVNSEIITVTNTQQSQDSPLYASKIRSLKKRRQSADIKSVTSEEFSLTNSQQSQLGVDELTDLKARQQPDSLPEAQVISTLKKRPQSVDSQSVTSEIISLTNTQHSQNLRFDSGETNDFKTRQKLQNSQSEASAISSLKAQQQSEDLKSVNSEIINVKNTQQSQDPPLYASKIRSLKKRRQSADIKSVTSEVISLPNSQQSQLDVHEPTGLKARQQPHDSLPEAQVISTLKRPQSVDSQSVTSEIINLTYTQQSQELLSDAGETSDLKAGQQPQVMSPDSSIISCLRKRLQSQDSKSITSDTNLKTRRQSQDSRTDICKIKSLKKRRQSQNLLLNNSSGLQSDSTDFIIPHKKAVKETIMQMECDKDFKSEKDEIEVSNYDEQNMQNNDILADLQPRKQSANSVPVDDVLSNSQPTKILHVQDTWLDSQPTKQSINSVPMQISLPVSEPKEQSAKNDGQDMQNHNILSGSQPKEQSTDSIPLQDILPDVMPQVIEQPNNNSLTIGKTYKGKKAIDNNNATKETPKSAKTNEDTEEKLQSAKKKGCRIVKQLLIDMVEGHPLLQAQTESDGNTPKRATRNSPIHITNIKNRRQALSEKLEKFKSDFQIVPLLKSVTESPKKQREKSSLSPIETIIPLNESKKKLADVKISFSSDDPPMSEDVIESSQDSTITTISVKSSKSVQKKKPVVILNKTGLLETSLKATMLDAQEPLDDEIVSLGDTFSSDQDNREDSQFPKNVTVENPELDLTENMDTQPVEDKDISSDVVFVPNEHNLILLNTENTYPDPNTQATAEANTESMNITIDMTDTCSGIETYKIHGEAENLNTGTVETQDSSTNKKSESLESLNSVEQNYSPSKDEPERKKDFLNNTQEISPIKILSPLREKQSPSPEANRDYVVIKLTSPVNSNGEPFEKCDSPEIFTEDKNSPDKRNESPPRVEVTVNNTSPSSSLSLKKNRPQRRAGGRAAQMLDLCAIMNKNNSAEATDIRSAPLDTPAKRNLKTSYNTSVDDTGKNIDTESAERENFLEFKKSLPTANCSPGGPILKRKFTEITDETTTSPANKRKRVSFHDPPVSTTVAVQKYIEPGPIRSPQLSTTKRRDRPVRNHTVMKSPKRLESVFKLENVLSKAVESFTEDAVITSVEDTEMSSTEQTPTPTLEVVKTSDLNDTDPICPALLGCNDPIEHISAELSSPAMKSLFIKEMESKVTTIADLAKMTELEINRLCIKAPKVHVAKKVLLEYAFKKLRSQDPKLKKQENVSLITCNQLETICVDAEIQTSDAESTDCGMQTDASPLAYIQTQTDSMRVVHSSVQTNESGYILTKDVIASCLSERPDFVAQLSKQLEVSSVHMIAENTLSFDAVLELLLKKMTILNSEEVTNKVLEVQSKSNLSCNSTQNKLAFVQNYLADHFDPKDLILFCSKLLRNVYDKPT